MPNLKCAGHHDNIPQSLLSCSCKHKQGVLKVQLRRLKRRDINIAETDVYANQIGNHIKLHV